MKKLLAILLTLSIMGAITGCSKTSSSSNASGNSGASTAPAGNNGDGKQTGAQSQTNSGNSLFNEFSLTDLEGNVITQDNIKGKIAIINFWATWCPPCINEMPEFQKIYNEIRNRDDVILIMADLMDGAQERKEDVVRFISENNYDLPVYLDEGGKLFSKIKGTGIPQTFILDKNGNEKWKTMGSTQYEIVMQEINKISEADKSESPFDSFSLMGMDGSEITSDDIKGKKVIFNFWATWCPPCQDEMPDFQRIYDEVKSDPDTVMVMAALIESHRDNEENVKAFIEENNYTLPVFYDKERGLINKLEKGDIPQTFILDREGNEVWKRVGSATYDEVMAEFKNVK